MKLFGVISNKEIDYSEVEKNFIVMKTSPLLIVKKFSLSSLFLGYLSLPKEPYREIYKKGGFIIIINGYIFNPRYIDYKTSVSRARKLNPFLSVDNFLDNYLKYGDRFFQDLNGSFVVVIYDVNKNKLKIVTDRYGSKSMIYTQDRDGFYFTSELKSVPKKFFKEQNINWNSVASILTYQQILGNETLLNNIFYVSPQTILSFEKDKINLTTYKVKNCKAESKLSKDEMIKKAIRLYKNSIIKTGYAASTLQKKLTLPLSGGYDTRLICSILKKYTDLKFDTISTDKDINIPLDSIIAKKIAKTLGVKNKKVSLSRDLYKKFLKSKIFLFDGMVTEEHLWIMPMMNAYSKSSVMIDGFGGDMIGKLSESSDLDMGKIMNFKNPYLYLLNIFLPKKLKKLPPGCYYPELTFDIGYTNNFLKDQYFKKIKTKQKNQIISILKLLKLNSPSLLTLFKFARNRIGSICFSSLKELKCFLLYPYLENQLFDFVVNIPSVKKSEINFSLTNLKKMIPDIMKIDSTNDRDIKNKYKKFSQNTVYNNKYTQKYLKQISRSLELPDFIKLSKGQFIKIMDDLIDNRSSLQDIALLEVLVWYNIFILGKDLGD